MPTALRGDADARGDSARRLNSAQLAGQTVVADRPVYIAFRIPEGRGLLTVVAVLQPEDLTGCSWAVWYSALAPTGEFRKAPVNYIRLSIDGPIAKTMIEIINCGGSLPADLVEQLPVVKL